MIEKRRRERSNGSISVVWRVRWHDESGAERNKTFDRVADARVFDAKIRTLKRMGDLAELDAGIETLAEFWREWRELHAEPNLERVTRRLYARMWRVHVEPRLGTCRLRDLTPQAIARFRADLEADGVGAEAVRKTLTMLQGALQRAVELQRIRSNPVKLTRKPPVGRRHAVRVMTPVVIETMRARLLAHGLRRDAMLLSLRPLREDLFSWRGPRARPNEAGLLFPRADGELWRESDWRNWRRRVYAPAAISAGVAGARPYDLRHSFASLLIEEGRLSIVEIAAQLGHRPTVCLDTYAHVMAEHRGSRGVSAEQQILAARAEMSTGPAPARE